MFRLPSEVLAARPKVKGLRYISVLQYIGVGTMHRVRNGPSDEDGQIGGICLSQNPGMCDHPVPSRAL
jgi:hypothetical protein